MDLSVPCERDVQPPPQRDCDPRVEKHCPRGVVHAWFGHSVQEPASVLKRGPRTVERGHPVGSPALVPTSPTTDAKTLSHFPGFSGSQFWLPKDTHYLALKVSSIMKYFYNNSCEMVDKAFADGRTELRCPSL